MNSDKTEKILQIIQKCNNELGFRVLHQTIFKINMNGKEVSREGIRSFVIRNNYLAELITVLEHDKQLEIQMNFKQEIKEDSFDRIISSVNSFNNSSKNFAWRINPCLKLKLQDLQYATFLKIDDSIETSYKTILKKFVEQGINEYNCLSEIFKSSSKFIN